MFVETLLQVVYINSVHRIVIIEFMYTMYVQNSIITILYIEYNNIVF